MCDSALTRLEQNVAGILLLLERLQAENGELKSTVRRLTDDLEELRKEIRVKGEMVRRFEAERDDIRSRVEKIMRKVAALEKPGKEART